MLNYISNADLLNVSNSFNAALKSGKVKVAKAIKDTVSDWWNKANSELIDFESLNVLYNTLKGMVRALDHFQAELFENGDRIKMTFGPSVPVTDHLEHENNKLARENEMLKGQVERLKGAFRCMEDLADHRAEMIENLQADNDNLDRSLDLAKQALYIYRYENS